MKNKNVIIENEDLNENEFTPDIWEVIEEEDDVFDEDKFDEQILKGNVLETEFFESEVFDDEDDDWS